VQTSVALQETKVVNAELRNSHHFEHAGARLQNVIRRNRSYDAVGVYAVCSAHPAGIAAAAHEANAKDSILHVESTSSQVNQFGGYTGQNLSSLPRLFHP
jgi:hypothetical protein